MTAQPRPAKLVVYVALSEEFDNLVEVLRGSLDIQFVPEELVDTPLTCYRTVFGSIEAVFVPSGRMGNTHAATVCLSALWTFRPRNLVVLGIAGALDGEVHPGDVLVPTGVHEYAANSAAVSDDVTRFESSGNHYLTNARLLNRLANFRHTRPERHADWRAAAGRFRDQWFDEATQKRLESEALVERWQAKLVIGDDRILASGPTVGKSRRFVEWLKTKVDRKLVAIEMESAGVYAAAAQRTPAPRVLAIRGISDFADERKTRLETSAKQAFRRLAVANAIALLSEAARGGVFDDNGHFDDNGYEASFGESNPSIQGFPDEVASETTIAPISWAAERRRAIRDLAEGADVVIFSPQCSGKTTLFHELIHELDSSYFVVKLDSRAIPGGVESSDALFRWIADLIVAGCGGDPAWVEEAWASHDYDTERFDSLLEERLLPSVERPVLLAMDDADLVIRHLPRTRLFNRLRAYQSRRRPWHRFRVLATVRSTIRQLKKTYGEGSFFVSSRMLELDGFDDEQVRTLGKRLRVEFDDDTLSRCRKLLDGHPHMTRKLLTEGARSGRPLRDCLERATDLFTSELRRMANELEPEAAAHLVQVLRHDGWRIDNADVSDQLRAMGLVRKRGHMHFLRCDIYRQLGRWLP